MRTFNVRHGTKYDDESFKINFGGEGEYLQFREDENDVIWICDDENNTEVGIYKGDIDYMIRALEMAKDLMEKND